MGFSLDLQKGIYDQLTAEISAPVFDDPSKKQSYPYVVVGDDSAIAFDTDTSIGRDIISTIHVWDDYNGYARIKGIIDDIDIAMNRVLFSVPNNHLIDCEFDSSDVFFEPDGKTRHGVITFRILLDEA